MLGRLAKQALSLGFFSVLAGASGGCDALLSADDYRTAPGSQVQMAGDSCGTCRQQKCDSLIDACLADPQCAPFYPCEAECLDPGCWARCVHEQGAKLADAFQALGQLSECVADQCAADCRIDAGNFDCVNDFNYPRVYTLGETITLHTFLGDLIDNSKPLPGYRIRICPQSDDNACDEPYDETVCDDTGLQQWVVPAGKEGFRGFFKIDDPSGEDPRSYVIRSDRPLVDYHSDQPFQLVADPNRLGEQLVLAQEGLAELAPGTSGIYVPGVVACNLYTVRQPAVASVQPMTEDTLLVQLPSNGASFLTTSNWTILTPPRTFTVTFRSSDGQLIRRMGRTLEPDQLEVWSSHIFPQASYDPF